MKITIISIGKIKSSYEEYLIQEYLKKTPFDVEIIELEVKKKCDPTLLMQLEADLIIDKIKKNSTICVLDVMGKQFDSTKFSDLLFKSQPITFVIGGAFGLDQKIKIKANHLISFSNMTFPHKLVRVLLVEQIYRAYTIHSNHPYNK